MEKTNATGAGTHHAWGYRHVVVFMLWLIYVINYFDRISVLTFLPIIRQDLHLTHQQIGLAASIFFFAYSVAQISAGFLADRIGPRRVMAIAITVFTAVTFLTGVVQNFTQFLWLRLGLGLGEAHHFAPACKTIADWVPKSEKGRAAAFLSSTWQFAPAVIPIIVTSLAVALGNWRNVFYLLAIPGIIGMFLLFYFISDKPEDMLKRGRLSNSEYQYIKAGIVSEEESTTKLTLKTIVKDVSLWLWAFQQFFILAMYWGSTVWLSSFLYEQHGLDLRKMGIMASVPYILAFFATIIGGVLMDKVFHRTKPVALISFLTSIPILIYISRVPKGHTETLIIMLMLTGFFPNLVWGVVNAYPQIRYPKEVVGKVVGITICLGYMGAFLSPLIAGYLVETTATGVSYNKVFLMFSTCSALGAIVTCFLKEETYSALKESQGAMTATMTAGSTNKV